MRRLIVLKGNWDARGPCNNALLTSVASSTASQPCTPAERDFKNLSNEADKLGARSQVTDRSDTSGRIQSLMVAIASRRSAICPSSRATNRSRWPTDGGCSDGIMPAIEHDRGADGQSATGVTSEGSTNIIGCILRSLHHRPSPPVQPNAGGLRNHAICRVLR